MNGAVTNRALVLNHAVYMIIVVVKKLKYYPFLKHLFTKMVGSVSWARPNFHIVSRRLLKRG